jgi:soluble lytic murein transglycosylase-like protein
MYMSTKAVSLFRPMFFLGLFLLSLSLPAEAAKTTDFFAESFEFNVMKSLGHQKYNDRVTAIIATFLKQRNPKLSEKTAREYAWYITDAGREFGVDPFLVASILVKESTAKKDARSPKGAYGLMQIHWKAHQKSIRKAFGIIKTLDDLMEPQNNIRVGTYLFANHIRRYQDTDRALDRYLGAPRTSYKKTILDFYKSMSGLYLRRSREES